MAFVPIKTGTFTLLIHLHTYCVQVYILASYMLSKRERLTQKYVRMCE